MQEVITEMIRELIAPMSRTQIMEEMAVLAGGGYESEPPSWISEATWSDAVDRFGPRRLRQWVWGMLLEAELRKARRDVEVQD